MTRRQFFQHGDNAGKVLNASYLNTIEQRLSKLERLHLAAPVAGLSSMAADAIGLAFENKTYHFVKLQGDLAANGTALAKLGRWNSADDYFEDTDVQLPEITVEDFNNTKSCSGEWGIALEHPESKSKKYIFIPWPLGCGSRIAGYDETKRQVLTHMPVSEGCCLRWENTTSCD